MEAMPLADTAMHLQPSPTWYLYNADGAEPVRLLDDDGRAEPALSGTPQGVLASLAEAVHDAVKGAGLDSLRPWQPEVSAVLTADDEDVRPSLHLAIETLQRLVEAGAAFDFDPYV
jgi:hypothetical protein